MVRDLLAGALVASVSCVLATASCVQRPMQAPAAGDADGPAIETMDDGDPFGDPDVGAGIGSEPPVSSGAGEPGGSSTAPGGWFTYNVCVLLKNSCDGPRVAFCNSQSDNQVRGRCFSHVKDSAVAWQNYCYNEFRNE